MKKHKCIEKDCKERVCLINTRCKFHANLGSRNPNYIDGRSSILTTYYCKDCGKEIGNWGGFYGTGFCDNCCNKGERNHLYIDGRSLKKYYCKDCGIKIQWTTTVYGSGKCLSCSGKDKAIKYRDKYINSLKKATEKSLLKPTKLEKRTKYLLDTIIPKEYKYVGNGKFWIEHFNPDFINVNGQKKIIEVFGDYWHKLKDAIKRDKIRLKTYKKYGYKTLILWENEFIDRNTLKQKIISFKEIL